MYFETSTATSTWATGASTCCFLVEVPPLLDPSRSKKDDEESQDDTDEQDEEESSSVESSSFVMDSMREVLALRWISFSLFLRKAVHHRSLIFGMFKDLRGIDVFLPPSILLGISSFSAAFA